MASDSPVGDRLVSGQHLGLHISSFGMAHSSTATERAASAAEPVPFDAPSNSASCAGIGGALTSSFQERRIDADLVVWIGFQFHAFEITVLPAYLADRVTQTLTATEYARS